MATYSYECSKCGHMFDAEQRMADDPLSDCPKCASRRSLKRLIQPVAVHFNGPGFHVNDYAPKCSGEPKSCPSCGPKKKPSKKKVN